jgi:hypothetical protein
MRVHCRPKHFSTTKIISKISWNIRISSIRKNNPPACPLASGYRTCMTAGRPSYNCRKKNCEQWRSKNFCLTKPGSALLSGEELNSCSHCERFLGLSAVYTMKLMLRTPRQAIIRQRATFLCQAFFWSFKRKRKCFYSLQVVRTNCILIKTFWTDVSN